MTIESNQYTQQHKTCPICFEVNYSYKEYCPRCMYIVEKHNKITDEYRVRTIETFLKGAELKIDNKQLFTWNEVIEELKRSI